MAPNTPLPRPPKQMSSNLMTMKFMQRAAASQSQSQTAPATAAATAPPTTPGSSELPSTKRRKTTDTRTPDYGRAEALAGSAIATPPVLSDLQRMEMATAEEEAKRERAIERIAAEAGETKWVLSSIPLENFESQEVGLRSVAMRITRAGYGDIDDAEGGSLIKPGGRRSFGKFNPEIERNAQTNAPGHSPQPDSSSEYSSSDGGDGEVGEVGEVGATDINRERDPLDIVDDSSRRSKTERKAKREAQKQGMVWLTEERKPKDVKLHKLSSISGGGGGGGVNGKRDVSQIECFQCGKKGHEKRDCPQKVGKRDRDTGSRKRKKSEGSLDY